MTMLRLMLVTVSWTLSSSTEYNPLSETFINHINSIQSDWKAGRNFDENTKIEDLKYLTCLQSSKHEILERKQYLLNKNEKIPTEFDSRKQWPHCPSISKIRDQGHCGSCWAFAGVEVISDRHCIHTNISIDLSAQDVVGCALGGANGCNGGLLEDPFDFWIEKGIVSGGLYNSCQGCLPYEIPPCSHHSKGTLPNCDTFPNYFPKCKKMCRPGYTVAYKDDKHYGESVYSVEGERQIQKEIITNGPVSASIIIYNDFLHYKTGVYRHVSGDFKGYHAVKIIGWGVESGKKYWHIANSWNSEWGDKGYFKIRRGKNDCDIESRAVAGLPEI